MEFYFGRDAGLDFLENRGDTATVCQLHTAFIYQNNHELASYILQHIS